MSEPNFYKKGILLLIIGLFTLFFAFQIRPETNFEPTTKLTPMHTGPLSITEEFKFENFVFSGKIYNSSNEDITLDSLNFTFFIKGYRNVKYKSNIIIPAKSTYTLYQEEEFITYYETNTAKYNFVRIEINGKEEYLFHSNYGTESTLYLASFEEEKQQFDNSVNITKGFKTILIISSIILIPLSIYFFIDGHKKHKKYYKKEN